MYLIYISYCFFFFASAVGDRLANTIVRYYAGGNVGQVVFTNDKKNHLTFVIYILHALRKSISFQPLLSSTKSWNNFIVFQ